MIGSFYIYRYHLRYVSHLMIWGTYTYICMYDFFFFHEPHLSINLHNMQPEVFDLLDTTQLKRELCCNKCNFNMLYNNVYE